MPSNVQITVAVPGAETFSSWLQNLQHVPDDWRGAWDAMAEDFWAHNQQTFDLAGPGWKPLTEDYAKWKARKYPGAPILVRTGALRDSLVSGFAPHSVFEVFPTEMRIGTDVSYAMYHQTGSIKVHDHPPKRSPVTIPDTLQTQWNRRLVNWLRDEIDYQG